MAVLRDFTVITGASGAFDEEFAVGRGGTATVESRPLRLAFNTGGRRSRGGALLMFSVKGLTRTDASPQVRINGQRVGEIAVYTPGADPEFPDNSSHWYSQTIAFDAGVLNNGNGLGNTLEIDSVGTLWRDREGTREDFSVRSLVCFFPQRSDSGSSFIEDVASGIGTAITGFVDVVTTVVNAVIEVFESTVGWLIDVLAFFGELLFSIPVIGRLLKWAWNLGLTGFWAVSPLGIVDFLGALVGILPEKKLRLCAIILRDELGDLLDEPEDIVPLLQNTIDIFRREANVRVIPSAPFQFDSAFAGREVATEEWVHTQSRGRNDASLIDVGCNEDAALEDLGTVGGRFELLASTTCLYSNARRVVGYGAPVVVFIVRSVGDGKTGCSLGPLTDYVTVEAGRPPRSTVIAHEVAHACNLWHVDDRTNLMDPDRTSNRLTRLQVALLRSSRHVSYS